MMTLHLRILSWALIFILHLMFSLVDDEMACVIGCLLGYRLLPNIEFENRITEDKEPNVQFWQGS